MTLHPLIERAARTLCRVWFEESGEPFTEADIEAGSRDLQYLAEANAVLLDLLTALEEPSTLMCRALNGGRAMTYADRAELKRRLRAMLLRLRAEIAAHKGE